MLRGLTTRLEHEFSGTSSRLAVRIPWGRPAVGLLACSTLGALVACYWSSCATAPASVVAAAVLAAPAVLVLAARLWLLRWIELDLAERTLRCEPRLTLPTEAVARIRVTAAAVLPVVTLTVVADGKHRAGGTILGFWTPRDRREAALACAAFLRRSIAADRIELQLPEEGAARTIGSGVATAAIAALLAGALAVPWVPTQLPRTKLHSIRTPATEFRICAERVTPQPVERCFTLDQRQTRYLCVDAVSSRGWRSSVPYRNVVEAEREAARARLARRGDPHLGDTEDGRREFRSARASGFLSRYEYEGRPKYEATFFDPADHDLIVGVSLWGAEEGEMREQVARIADTIRFRPTLERGTYR